MRNYSKHLPHYIGLFGILIISLIGFYIFSYDTAFQLAIIIAASISYVTWGIVHHAIHKDLYLSVVIEYITIAVFCVTVVFSLILNK